MVDLGMKMMKVLEAIKWAAEEKYQTLKVKNLAKEGKDENRIFDGIF